MSIQLPDARQLSDETLQVLCPRALRGIELADRTVGLYLRRWGYTSKKPGRHSRKQDPDEVEQWLLETYPAIEAQAEHENAQICWTEEVGVSADHHPGCGYARQGERATLATPQPHIRVNQITAICTDGDVGFLIYPTHVGKTLVGTFCRPPASVHPHACGKTTPLR